uniref:Glycosyltransferase 2-like domain-containing protein n=1 Tax=viral metagenome TaxID=1070528 RepID=A0A6C0IXI1_9ZZZZ
MNIYYYAFLIPIINFTNIFYILLSLFFFFFYKTLKSKPRILKNKLEKKKLNIAILIPIYNEAKNLKVLIKNLFALENNIEVIFINDLSTDNSLNILEKYQQKYNYTIITRKNKKGYVAGVLNEGLKVVSKKVDYVGVLNGDCHFDITLIQNIKILLENYEIQILNLSNTVQYPNNFYQYLGYIEKQFKNGLFKYSEASLNNGYFIKKDILEKIGGWDEDCLTEDLKLNLSIKSNGYKIFQCDYEVIDKVPNSLYGLFNQKYRWIKGDIEERFKNLPKDIYELVVMIYYIFPLFTLFSCLFYKLIIFNRIFIIQFVIFIIEGMLNYKFTGNIIDSIIYPISQFCFSVYFYLNYITSNKNKW